MSGIFLSYRRDDSAGWAGRLHEHLVRDWGPDQVFIDIDAIAPGDDFREAITRTMQTCDVVIVVIGPNWLGARDRAGNRRLDDESDTHRTEVAAALAADLRVIPVLVGGAEMPTVSELPEPLQALCYRNAAIIEDRRFASDTRALMDSLKQFAEELARRRLVDDEARRAAEQEARRQADEAARRAGAWAQVDHTPPVPPPPPPPPSAVRSGVGLDALGASTVSRGTRFGAALIDAMILALLFVPALIFAGVSPKEPCEDDPTRDCITDAAAGVATGLSLVGLVSWSAYMIMMDGGAQGQTLGKRATGVRVVDPRTGGTIGYARATGRTVLLVASLSCCWIILIVDLFRSDPRQLLHDRIVGSALVKT